MLCRGGWVVKLCMVVMARCSSPEAPPHSSALVLFKEWMRRAQFLCCGRNTVWIKYVSHCDSHRSLAVGFSSGGRTGLQHTAHHFKSTSFLIFLFNDELFHSEARASSQPARYCNNVTCNFGFTSLKSDELLSNSFIILRCLFGNSKYRVTVFVFATHSVTTIF